MSTSLCFACVWVYYRCHCCSSPPSPLVVTTIIHSMCIAFHFISALFLLYLRLPAMPLKVNIKKKYENKTKTTNESGDSCLCENWLAHVHCHGANVIHDEMKLRCEIIQISFPFIQAPLFKCLILIKKIMNNARAYTKTQRIKLNQMNYCRMWAGERPVSTAGCVHAIDIW